MRPSPIATCPSVPHAPHGVVAGADGQIPFASHPIHFSPETKPEAEERRRKEISSKPEAEKMNKFDPWPVFFRREWRRNWPFLTGFAITGFLITKMTASFTEEDLKNSPFVQKHKKFQKH